MLPSFLSSGSWKQCDHQVCNLVSGRDHTATCPPSTILSRLSKLHHLAHWLCQFLIFSGWDHTAACLLLPPGKSCVLGMWTHLRGEGGCCQGFCKIFVSTIFSHKIYSCQASFEANLDLTLDWRGRDVAEEELLEELPDLDLDLPDLEDMEHLLAQLIH